MLSVQTFDEIRVYEGIAERTGVQFERNEVRHSDGLCRSLTEFTRKARNSGDGYFFIPAKLWPAGTERFEVLRKWVGFSELPI